MSIVCYHVRAREEVFQSIRESPEIVFDDQQRPDGIELLYIDKAYDALSWLASPVKRAETAHNARLFADPDWPDEEAQASVAKLSAMPVDDVLAAIEGRTDQRLEGFDLGLGAAGIFLPERVRSLSETLSAVSEFELRAKIDFERMDQDDVQPGYWVEEGEDTFQSYILPALERLKQFYGAAARSEDAVLVAWT